MIELLAYVALAVMLAIVLWRPHGWGPALGSAVAVAIVAAAGLVEPADLEHAGRSLWRPVITLVAIMVMTSAAEQLGVIDRIAALIEPRTRGPVRHAFRVTFVISALVAAVLSNNGAILLLTPAVIVLIRTVYPRRYPKFQLAFAFAVFAGAGVAPLVISNPMNLVAASHAGIGFNAYAAVMVPVAAASWVATYACLAWAFRDVLADEAPALGAWPTPAPLRPAAWLVVGVLAVVLAAYPIASYLDGPLWVVASAGAAICVAAVVGAGVEPRRVAAGVSWNILPFLAGTLLVALALERAGAVDRLAWLFTETPAPLATIGATAAVGSALLNNHPMSLLDALALDRVPGATDVHVLAALVGGDLGPRLLPVGSLAGLLWLDVTRRHGIVVSIGSFVRIGLVLTVLPMATSLAMLWLLG